MTVSKAEALEARISHGEETTSLTEGIKGSGRAKVEPLKVSCRMKVILSAEKDTSSITPITPDEIRILDPQEPYSSWQWSVNPKKPGIHDVHLVAEAIAEFPKLGERPLYLKTFDYAIKVKVSKESLFDWVWQYWQYILGTIVIPLVGWLLTLYRRRKEKGSSDENKPPSPPKTILLLD